MRRSISLYCLFLGITYLLFFRPSDAFILDEIYDDHCYMVWLYRIVGLAPEACYSAAHTFGTAIPWIPAGILGRIIATITGQPPEPIIATLVGLTAYLLWGAALFLIARICAHISHTRQQTPPSPYLAIVALLNVPLLYYACRRTMMSHPTEFFFACLAIYLILKRMWGWAFLTYIALVATRINHLPFALVLAGAAIDQEVFVVSKKWKKRIVVLSGLATVILAVPILRIAFVTGYDFISIPLLIQSIDARKISERLFTSSFPLFFTATSFVFVFVWALCRFKKLNWMNRGAVVWVAIQFFICVLWPTNGSSFGLRYLIGAYAGILLLWRYLDSPKEKFWSALTRSAGIFNALWLLFLTWIYGSQLWPWRLAPLVEENALGHFSVLGALGHPVPFFGQIIYSSFGSLYISFFPHIFENSRPQLLNHAFSGMAAWLLLTWTLLVLAGTCYAASRFFRPYRHTLVASLKAS